MRRREIDLRDVRNLLLHLLILLVLVVKFDRTFPLCSLIDDWDSRGRRELEDRTWVIPN